MCAKRIEGVYQQAMADLESLHLSVTNAMCKAEPGSWQAHYFAALGRALDDVLCMRPVEDGAWERLENVLGDDR